MKIYENYRSLLFCVTLVVDQTSETGIWAKEGACYISFIQISVGVFQKEKKAVTEKVMIKTD